MSSYLNFELHGAEAVRAGIAGVLGVFRSFTQDPNALNQAAAWDVAEWDAANQAAKEQSAELALLHLSGKTAIYGGEIWQPAELLVELGGRKAEILPSPSGQLALMSETGVIVKITCTATSGGLLSPEGTVIGVDVSIDFRSEERAQSARSYERDGYLAAAIIDAAGGAVGWRRAEKVEYFAG